MPIYKSFWLDGLGMLEEAFPDTLERVEDLPPELLRAECALPPAKGGSKKQQQQQQQQQAAAAAAPPPTAAGGRTEFEVYAFRVPGVIRMARAAVLSTTPAALAPQVLNFVIFPDPSLDAPIFGADLVQLPGGHLIVLDFQPVAPPLSGTLAAAYARRLGELRERYRGLPDGGALPDAAQPFFSPSFLFTRLPAGDPRVDTVVRAAFQDFLALYLEMLREVVAVPAPNTAEEDPRGRAAAIREGHVAYATYRAVNDPARGMLTRMFGAEWTERVIHEVLFDWAAEAAEAPKEEGSKGGGGATS